MNPLSVERRAKTEHKLPSLPRIPPVHQPSTTNWNLVRRRAADLPESAFQFVREGLGHTVRAVFGPEGHDAGEGHSRHITGQQLCHGLRELAYQKYGLLAGSVMQHWGLRETQDFGVLVYAMIDRGEMRSCPSDRFEDFRDVYDFTEAFPVIGPAETGLKK